MVNKAKAISKGVGGAKQDRACIISKWTSYFIILECKQ